MKSSLLRRAPSNAARFLFFVLVSIAVMVIDYRTQYFKPARSAMALAVYPIQLVAALPERVGSAFVNLFVSEDSLRTRNKKLHAQQLMLLARLQKFDALESENRRLRELLGAAEKVADRALMAELVEVSLEPFTQKIMINKGETQNLYIGQPIIDAYGIMGQITELTPVTAVATLITDPSHAVPVQVKRNGLRAILFGTGSQSELDLPHLTPISDIREGDLLVTSGMGGRFPVGYPVARVGRIVSDPNESFLTISAEPIARLDHSTEVLVIWPGRIKADALPPAEEVAR